jgi:K+-transporting ATPase ATPase B chain
MPATKKRTLIEKEIIFPAMWESVKKLNPINLLKNPVIFVTEVGAVISTIELFINAYGEHTGFNLQIAVWLWFTVLFANFAEALAEGRGKAQADNLRKTRRQT